MQIEKSAGVEETGKNLQGALFESVGSHARGDNGIVVRPDRSVVVRHRIEADLRCGDGSDTPSVETGLGH